MVRWGGILLVAMGTFVPNASGAPSRGSLASETRPIRAEAPARSEKRSKGGKKAAYLASQLEKEAPRAPIVARGPFFASSGNPTPARTAEDVINIYNKWTHEFVAVDAATADALEVDADTFFRCHFTGEPKELDPRLVRNLVLAARHFNVNRVNVISGYRAPKYNLILRKKGRQVARESQHTQGNAIDFRLPGVPIRKLYRWVKKRRLGGVGFYAKSHFIHMDTGPIRTWTGR